MNKKFVRLIALFLCSGCLPLAGAGSANELETISDSTPTGEFRDFAAQSFAAFEQGDYQKALLLARMLENVWDHGSASLRFSAPEVWSNADKAMDTFIDPLSSYPTKPLDKGVEASAYRAYSKSLDDVDHVWKDESLQVRKTPSGVTIIVTKPSAGRQPKPGEIVTLRIRAFANGTEFRTSNPGDPEWIWLLADRHAPGFIEAMTSIHAGESAVIVVPPGLGFGPKGGRKGTVTPNALLTYFVDVYDVKARELLEVLHQTMKAQGVNAALEQFKTLRAQDFPDILCNEQQVNGFGYEFLEKGDVENAIKVLALNAELFPKSANVYDSLGEAYAKNGQREEAIASYRKALAIDPKMESSAKALQELESK